MSLVTPHLLCKHLPAHVIPVAIGIVFNADGKILVSRRPPDKLQGGFWEFPGGKIEPSENAEQALKRELFEEVGIVVLRAIHLTQIDYSYAERQVNIEVWRIEQFSGEAYGREGQEIAWLAVDQLSALDMLSANKPILELLRGYD
jgi:8-oxo-dGTP diphosphatase